MNRNWLQIFRIYIVLKIPKQRVLSEKNILNSTKKYFLKFKEKQMIQRFFAKRNKNCPNKEYTKILLKMKNGNNSKTNQFKQYFFQ